MPDDVVLEIALPVYREGEAALRPLQALAAHSTTPKRVLLCYDDDSDPTLEAVKDFDAFEVRPVKNTGRGPHGAVLTGFAASTAPVVAMMPADDDYNAHLIDTMVARIQGGAEIVCPSRFMPGGTMVGCPPLKAALVRTAAFALKHAGRMPTHDATNGFRLFSRRVIDEIEIESTEGFTYALEYLVKAHRLGWRIDEIPAEWYERGSGQGKSRFKVLRWVPHYVEWLAYGFETTWRKKGPETVRLRHSGPPQKD